MELDFVHGGMLHPRPSVESLLMSPSIPMQYCSSETPWSHIDKLPSNVDQGFEHGANWDLELETRSSEMPLHVVSDESSAGDALPLPYSSFSAIEDSGFREFALNSLALLPEQTGKRGFCSIKAKPTLSSPGSIEAIKSNVVATQRARNVGRRCGPLDAKTREGANKVRKIRACANCRTKKIRVSNSRYP
jgi:hypothetical protein